MRALWERAITFQGAVSALQGVGALDADLLEVRMRRLLDSGPRLGSRRARVLLGLAALLLALAGLTAAGLAFDTPRTAGAAAGELSPFMGVWTGESSPEPGVTLPAGELVIQQAGDRPIVSLTWFRHRRQQDGTVETVPVHPRVLDPRITGRTLRFRTRAEMQYRPDGPKETVELDQVFELQGRDEGRLRQVWSSLEGRNDVPPPPPPTLLKRRAPLPGPRR